MDHLKKLNVAVDLKGRRMFLKGLGTTMVAIPFLPSLLSKSAQAADAPLPKLILSGSTHGRWQGSWYPGGLNLPSVGTNIRAMALNDIAGPLGRVINTSFDGIRDKVNIIQGLDYLSVTNHDQAIYTASNRVHIRDGLGANFTPTFPYSLDVILASAASFYQVPPALDVLRIAPRKESGFPWEGIRGVNGRRGDGEANWLPCYGDSLSRVASYLNGFIDSSNASANDLSSKRFIIDKVLGSFRTLIGSSSPSADDKRSLQQYVDSLTDLQRGMSRPGGTPIACSPFVAGSETTDNDEFNRKLIDMMVIALSCNITRIATYELNWDACAQQFGGVDYHGSFGVHSCNNGTNYENIANWTSSFVKHYAYMVRKMDQAGLLDSSLVVYANEMSSSYPNHHGCDIPVLTAGSLNGTFKTGDFISYYNHNKKLADLGGRTQNFDLSEGPTNYEIFAGRKWNEMMISILTGMGVPAAEYERDGRKGFGSYSCLVSEANNMQCGNGASDSYLQRRMVDSYSDYSESVYATLPYLYRG